MLSLSLRLLAVTWLAIGICCDGTMTSTTWSVSQDNLTCSTPQRRFTINDTGHDAILITLRSEPSLDDLFCDDDLDLRISFGEQGVLGSDLCSDTIRAQLTFYTTSLSVAVTRSTTLCDTKKAFRLSVDYSLLHCWNTPALHVSGNQTLRVTYPCGRVHTVDLHISQLYHSDEVFGHKDGYNTSSIVSTLEDSLAFDWSSWRQPATEMDLRINKTIRLVQQLPFWVNVPLCDRLNITFDLFPSTHSVNLCPLDDFLTISEAADLVRTRLVLQLSLLENQYMIDYLTSFSIGVDISFGPRGYWGLLEEGQLLLPFRFWQSDLELRARFLFGGYPFLDSWLYRLYIDVPPGRKIDARWIPLEQQEYAISFWDPVNRIGDESGNGLFRASLGTYLSGEAKSISNRMVMEVAVKASSERTPRTVVYLHSTPMANMCDESDGNSTATVFRQILENTETFAAFKTGMGPTEEFNCRLTFRTLTDDAVFLARTWLISREDGCQRSMYYVVFGESNGRYVQFCTYSSPSVFILSGVVSLVAYLRQSPSGDDFMGIAGQFMTTCPPVSNGTCRWINGTHHSRLGNKISQYVVYCGAILSTQLASSIADAEVACLFTLTAVEHSWQQVFAQPNRLEDGTQSTFGVTLTDLNPASGLFASLHRKINSWPIPLYFNYKECFFAFHVVAALFHRAGESVHDTVTLYAITADQYQIPLYQAVEGRLERVFYTAASSFYLLQLYSTWLSFIMEFNAVPRAPFHPRGRRCPLSFVHLAEHCYNVTLLSHAISPDEAGKECARREATLLTIADKDEADVVLRLLEPISVLYQESSDGQSSVPQPSILLGLRRFNGIFRWDDAAVPLGFQAWYHPSDFEGLSKPIFSSFLALNDSVSQPTDDNGDCVLMSPLRPDEPRLNWAVVPCHDAFPSKARILQICMVRNRLEEATTASWPTTFCPPGWFKLSDKCEKLVTMGNMTAAAAEDRCAQETAALAAFNSSLHSLLFRLLMQQQRDGDKWMNNTERGQLSAYRLLSGLRRSLVPLSAPVTGGVICEKNAEHQVNVQHGFEVLCASGVFISFTRGCEHATCDDNITDPKCPSAHDATSSRSNQTRQYLWAMDTGRPCDEEVITPALVEAMGGWIELNKTARKEEVVLTANRTCWEDSVVCARSERECTPQSTICIYGVPGCTDGSHLLDCESFECPFLFKCPHSYCIHLDRVGDGTNDCPHGHDELLGEGTCAGLYRCGTRCIPLGYVCDHVVHCEGGEDELFCPRPPNDYCPPGCTCQNVQITCDRFNSSIRIPAVTESVDLSGGYLTTFSLLDMNIARRLLFLNLSSNLLLTIPRNTFACLRSLLHLDLSHNRLKSLQLGAFEGLLALRYLSLTGNRITTVESFAFAPLQNITQLDLGEMQITVIPGNAFSGMQKLQTLKLGGNPIEALEKGAFRGLPALLAIDMQQCNIKQFDAELFDEDMHLETFLSDVEELCCAPSSVTRCEPFSLTLMPFCRRLLQVSHWSWIGPPLIAVGMLGCLSVIVWMLVREKKNEYRGMMSIMFINHMLIGVASALLHVADSTYGNEFFVFSRAWTESGMCLAAGMLIVVGCIGSSGTLAVLLATYLCKLKRALQIFSLLAVLVVQLSVLLPWLMLAVHFYAQLPACVPLLLLHHPWWLLSLLWMLFIVVLPQPWIWTAMSRVRSEFSELKKFNLRTLSELIAKLYLLRALLVCLVLTVSNLAVGTLWLLEAFYLLGEGQPGHLWSTITLLSLHLVLQPLVFGLSVVLDQRYMKRNL